jgi:hypothetical protein
LRCSYCFRQQIVNRDEAIKTYGSDYNVLVLAQKLVKCSRCA